MARMGGTLVLCTASVVAGVPTWRRAGGLGWLTAEYAMLPRATTERTPRERYRMGGRTSEIQRIIGRSLRAALRTFGFGQYTIHIDCDVLQADGGTRTAAITGGAVALADACVWLERQGATNPFGRLVAGVSVGIVDGETRLDLAYVEDSAADVDANVVMAHPDKYVEVQSSAEAGLFSQEALDRMLGVARRGTLQLFEKQRATLGW